jgi:hypothetical protein
MSRQSLFARYLLLPCGRKEKKAGRKVRALKPVALQKASSKASPRAPGAFLAEIVGEVLCLW